MGLASSGEDRILGRGPRGMSNSSDSVFTVQPLGVSCCLELPPGGISPRYHGGRGGGSSSPKSWASGTKNKMPGSPGMEIAVAGVLSTKNLEEIGTDTGKWRVTGT
jgi:hypothetical protein